jgi:hypothetical protein
MYFKTTSSSSKDLTSTELSVDGFQLTAAASRRHVGTLIHKKKAVCDILNVLPNYHHTEKQICEVAPVPLVFIKTLKPKEREREEKIGGGDINLDLRLRRSPGSARSSFW